MYCVITSYTEKGMRDADTSSFGITVEGKAISNLRYTDDTALIENSKETIEHLTENVNEVGKQLNLKLNVRKTKLMVAGSPKEEYNITIDCRIADCSGDIKSRTARRIKK